MAYVQAAGVQFLAADPTFIKAVKDRTAPLEEAWFKAAAERGLKDPKKALADYRAEIAKQEK